MVNEQTKKETPTSEVSVGNKSLATIAKKFKYGDAELALVKQTIAVGATDTELALFLTICRNKNLDPFSNQIYFIKRKVWNKTANKYDEKVSIQTGIDGYRSIAERTNKYAGSDDPVFEIGMDNKPTIARVTIWKMVESQKVAFTASARWSEYAPRDERQAFMWNKMPFLMLGKVAEALALRKAFPNDLSGIYTKEEMDQQGGEPVNGKEIKVPVKGMDNSRDDQVPYPTGEGKMEDINDIVPGNPPVNQTNMIGMNYDRLKTRLDQAKSLDDIEAVRKDGEFIRKTMTPQEQALFRSNLANARERVVQQKMGVQK